MQNENLANILEKWDGRHTNYLTELYKSNLDSLSFIDEIIHLYLQRVDLQLPTSWIIKHFIDNGERLSQTQVDTVLSHAMSLEHWESQLHILQLIPKLTLRQRTADSLEPFIRENLNSDKKFVKAAAYEAYYEIVKLYPSLANEFRILCEEALVSESASVISKVKKILKKLKTDRHSA